MVVGMKGLVETTFRQRRSMGLVIWFLDRVCILCRFGGGFGGGDGDGVGGCGEFDEEGEEVKDGLEVVCVCGPEVCGLGVCELEWVIAVGGLGERE